MKYHFKGFDFVLSSTFTARNDGTSMTHTSAGRSSQSGNERDDWFPLVSRVVLCEVSSSCFLSTTTNLADEDNSFRLWIVQKDFKTVDEVSTVKWVTANADAQRLAKTNLK